MESLESLVCGVAGAGAGDRKVSCETVIAGGSGDASPPPPPPDPDFPPESITIPIGDEVAFSELNPIYERDDSTKGSTNPKFAAAAGAANPIAAKTRSNSTRVAGAAAPAAAGTTFFGLPAKIRPPFSRRQPSQGRILPDKRGGRGDGEVEPRSPKVSCIGKVLSDRERHGRRRRSRRPGWWHGVVAMFRCDGCCRSGSGGGGSAAKKMTADDEDGDELQPGITGMRRFKSGRRAASWGDEALAAAAGENEDDAEKEQQQTEYRQETEQWARRQVN
ncbi:hypothetical protein PR202_ga08957 [Eleusine coracana subsp. coracana]|uniref:Uncharacterized protein n=1 Tax=Eleusine coracana subsp. coracana TaxID=191504 RepID=A0AAV5C1X4_ELECO|nr:hypothetical protein QOZ80_1AG0040770 [Eleusine coracana subsp. coracana]GJM92481.1 hypothetical protein PR202_ga08957 [Eleusine coracana subsp. coracana]